MNALRLRIPALVIAAMLAVAAPGCSTDDAAKKDANKAGNKIEKEGKKAKNDVKDATNDDGN